MRERSLYDGSEYHYIVVYMDSSEASFMSRRMLQREKFKLAAVKSINSGDSLKRETKHNFSTGSSDERLPLFFCHQDALNPQNGYLVNDTLTLRVSIKIKGKHDSRRTSKLKTGFVGIKSFRKTSVLSSFLQCLFHIKAFRKAVFQVPTAESDDLQKSLPLSLQHLFYTLQYQNRSPKFKDLIKALDWDCNDLRLRCNVPEIQRILFGKLGEEDKAGSIKNCISKLLMGEYSSCRESSKCKQSYIDIPLDIVECKDIYASLERFCQTKRLEEDNHEHTTRNGAGDSKQYVLFDSFPTVLFFHLKRCYYSADRNAIVRVNHPFCLITINPCFSDELSL